MYFILYIKNITLHKLYQIASRVNGKNKKANSIQVKN